MACVVHVLLPIRQKVRDAEVLSPPVCASLCLWNRGRRPVEILVWQTAAFCLANRRLLPGILRPRVPSRLVLGLTYSQLFTFHRVLWRCAATSGARGRHASVLMLCVSGKNIKAGVLRRKKLLKNSCIIRKSKFPQNPKRSVRFSGKRTKRSVQKRKARNTQKAETKVL